MNISKANHAVEEIEEDHEFHSRIHLREDFILEKIAYSVERFRPGNGE